MAIKFQISFLLLLCSFHLIAKGQVDLNNRVIADRVHIPRFGEDEKDEFFYKIAQFAYLFSNKFYDNNCPIYIAQYSSKDYFFVGVDNDGGSYSTELIFNNVKEDEIGLEIIVPDTCFDLEIIAKLLDLGFRNYEMLKKCKSLRIKQMDVNLKEYIAPQQCELTDILIKSALECNLSKKKAKYIRRFRIRNSVYCNTLN